MVFKDLTRSSIFISIDSPKLTAFRPLGCLVGWIFFKFSFCYWILFMYWRLINLKTYVFLSVMFVKNSRVGKNHRKTKTTFCLGAFDSKNFNLHTPQIGIFQFYCSLALHKFDTLLPHLNHRYNLFNISSTAASSLILDPVSCLQTQRSIFHFKKLYPFCHWKCDNLG